MKSRNLCYTTLGEDMNETLIKLTDQTIDEFKYSSAFYALKKAQSAFYDDDLDARLKTYQTWQERYQDVKKYGQYHPDLQTVKKEFQAAKIELYTHPKMIAYQKALTDFQRMLDDFSFTLVNAVSPHINSGHIPH
jgi:cell fate (sporulation/competence/biofilm development) regulator YlbF (YheA/YmcA/DUF963 family)